jgi:hypothetical protein
MKKFQTIAGLLFGMSVACASHAVAFDLSVAPTYGGSSSSKVTKQWNVGDGWVKATAYYTSNPWWSGPAGLIQSETAVYNGGGLGVHNDGESTNAPYHAIDNDAGVEFVLLEFDSLYTATGFSLGYSGGQNSSAFTSMPDVQIWTGAASGKWANTAGLNLDAIDACYENCANSFSVLGFTKRPTSYATPVNTNVAIPGTASASRYMIVSGELGGSVSDAFKFKTVTGTRYVPEPTSMTLLGLGFAGLMFSRVRRKS